MSRTANPWIDGRFLPQASGGVFASLDPARSIELGLAADATRQEGAEAIAAARRAFDHGTWARTPQQRAAVLHEFADRLERASPAIAALLTAENGKLLRQSQHELALAVSELRYYAGLARNLFGRCLESSPGLHSQLQREAAGVTGIIVPWNAPVILLIRSLAPALAAGCTAVIKAAPQTALVSDAVMRELAAITALPVGVVNAVTESGSVVARLLVESADVDVISYTGSSEVGRRIMAAAAPTLKRLNLELGGSAPCLVFDDAVLERTVPAIVAAGLVMAGQQCVAASRLLLHRRIAAEATQRFAAALRNVRLGPGDDPASELGPMIDRRSRDRILSLAAAASRDADIIVEPAAPGGALEAGAFVSAGLFQVRNRQAPFLTEEVFGPLLSIDTFADEDEAIALANATPYGLAASVWSSDLGRCQRVAAGIRAGTVWLNGHGRLLPELETGGYKHSGLGRLHGVEGLDDFLQTKHVQWQVDPQATTGGSS